MLALKYSHQLSWGDLKFIEDPMHAIRTVESEHGRRNGGKSIENAHLHDLPNGDDRRFDPYRFLKTKLERGDVFLVNRSTLAPAVTSLDIDDDGNPEYTLRHSTSQYFHSAFRSALRHIPESKPVGVLRDEPKQVVETKKPEKIINTKEKHQIKIKYVTVNGAENPDTYEVKLTVLDTITNRIHMRQAIDVLKHDTSKVFSIEKGEKFKIYPVREHMMDVREDFAQNKHFAQSEANKRIKPLDIEPSEEIQGGVTLHTVTIHVPPILRMGCFFDGTGNDTSDPMKFSNVFKLYEVYKSKVDKLPKCFHSGYVRGVGTEGDGWSEVLGSMGGFGAVDRIAGMVYKLEDACEDFKRKFKTYPEAIHLDVFGFSRGATTARHFMNVMKQGFYGFNDDNNQTYITRNNIMISFAGLFDSVGSYGMAGDDDDPGYNFNINPKWLTENGRVIHLIALNEYRDNFDLQTIFSHQDRYYTENIYTEKRSEIGMMGAHSDVGGGYAPNEQGVVNGQNNPSQMAVMSLQKMHELALQNGVPLDPLKAMSIEPALTDNYRIVNDAIQHPKARRLWMEWVEYLKYKEILEYRLNEMETQARPMAGRPASVMVLQQTRKKIETANISIADLERRLAPEIPNVDFEIFKEAFMHLDEHYIHESHGPFNKTPGMWTQKEGSLFTVDRIKRTVFFNEAKEFKKENTEWDRIARIAPAWMILAEIQDFDIIKAKEFK